MATAKHWPALRQVDVLVENSAAGASLGCHAACRYSLISPASLVLRRIRVAGTGNVMTSGLSSGARQAHAVALVAAAGVVVADVLRQDRPQVLLAADEHPVGALGPYRAHETLGVSVAPHRQLHLIRMIGTDASG
jgi:hypothetical protein